MSAKSLANSQQAKTLYEFAGATFSCPLVIIKKIRYEQEQTKRNRIL